MKDNFRITWPTTSWSILVPYSWPLEDLVARYVGANDKVNGINYPPEKTGSAVVNIGLLLYEVMPSDHMWPSSSYFWWSDESQGLLEEKGWRHALPQELLTFGTIHPDQLRYKNVFALGQRWLSPESQEFSVVGMITGSDDNLHPTLGLPRFDSNDDGVTVDLYDLAVVKP